MPGDEAMCRQAGIDDYVSKPVRADILKPKLNYWLRQYAINRDDLLGGKVA